MTKWASPALTGPSQTALVGAKPVVVVVEGHRVTLAPRRLNTLTIKIRGPTPDTTVAPL